MHDHQTCPSCAALREENARLTKEVEWWRDASDTGRIIRERDEAREALAELNAAGLKQYREMNRLKAEVARVLESLVSVKTKGESVTSSKSKDNV